MEYKQSHYNFTVPYNNKKLIFNALSGAIFSVTDEEYTQVFSKYIKNINLLKEEIPCLFHFLEKNGFVVSNKINEYEIITFRNTKSIFLNNHYRLVVIPTLNCNFKCWYCYEEHYEEIMSNETIEAVKNHINNVVTKNKIPSLMLDWYGGEPLLCFENIIYPIAKYCMSRCKRNNVIFNHMITTNGYLIDKYIEQIKEINLTNFQITLDGTEEKHNKVRNINGKGTFNKIISNIILLCDNIDNAHITLRINYDNNTLNGNISEILKLIPEKHRNKITPNLQRVWQTINKRKKQNNNVINLRNNWMNLKYNNGVSTNAFKLFNSNRCYVDRFYHTEINYDGKVFKCTARDFSDEQSVGTLKFDGKIEWKSGLLEKMYSKPTFENRMCKECKVLPLCAGPCSQKIRETKDEDLEKICILNDSEISVDEFIIELYKEKQRNTNALQMV